MVIGYVKHYGPRLEEFQVTLFICGKLTEGLKHPMGGPSHFAEGQKAQLIGLADLLECPPDTHIAMQSQTTVWRILKRRDNWFHRRCGHRTGFEAIQRGRHKR